MLSDIYFCNFSVFQSLPDSWAIGQVFPIMPIQRLGEKPTRNAVLADITCDSDGKIDRFVHPRITKRTLEVHELNAGRALLPGGLPGGRLPGNPGRPAQPVRRHPRGAHPAAGRRAAGGSRRSSRATPPTRCWSTWSTTPMSCIPRIARDCERAVQEGRMTLDRSPGGEALLRKRTQRLRLPRSRIDRKSRGFRRLPTLIPQA